MENYLPYNWARSILGCLLVLIHLSVLAQEPVKQKKISRKKYHKLVAVDQIKQLKKGVLLVRLQSRESSINSLKEVGKDSMANKLQRNQYEHNKGIVISFKENFNFCPVYFFFSNKSQNALNEKFFKGMFVNENLVADTSIILDNPKFLIAEFGVLEPDTGFHFSHISYEISGHFRLKKRNNYYVHTNNTLPALIMKSANFIQLRKPFPYYTRTFDITPSKSAAKKAIIKINSRLIRFNKRFG